MNEESVKNLQIYGLFVNQELVQEGTYEKLTRWLMNFDLNVRLQFGQENVETLINELDDETVNRLIRIETDKEVIFYDLRLLEKK